MSERVMILGGGGRGHALADTAWEAGVDHITVVSTEPNAGIEEAAEHALIDVRDTQRIAELAIKRNIDWAIIASDAAAAAGNGDTLRAAGVATFGPSKAAAQLEASKAYMGKFAREHGVVHAEDQSFKTAAEALIVLDPKLHVVKNDGLEDGKGVEDSEDLNALESKIREIEASGNEVVLQARLWGRLSGKNNEVSGMTIVDGLHKVMLPYSRDYKKLLNGGMGPNTGGMGAYSPLDDLTLEDDLFIQSRIIQPILEGCIEENYAYNGMLYPGVMLLEVFASLFEINVRPGDPEYQVISRMLDNTWLYNTMKKAAYHKLTGQEQLEIAEEAAVSVTLAAEGYPDNPIPGAEIHGLDQQYPGVSVFHGATRRAGKDKILAAGGRPLHVVGRGKTIPEARHNAYNAIGPDAINFPRMHYRTDIAEM